MSLGRREFVKRVATAQAGLALGGTLPALDALLPAPRPAPARTRGGAVAGDVIVVGAGAFGVWTSYYLATMGAKVTLVAPSDGEIQGMKHGEKGERFRVDMTLDDAHPDEFDAVLLPGGALNADKLRMDPRARNFVQRFDQARKPIAAISTPANAITNNQ